MIMSASADSPFRGKYEEKTGKPLSLLVHTLEVAIAFRARCDLDGIRLPN